MSENAASTQPADQLDAFEAFNRAQGMGTVRSPYPAFAELRRQGPVVKVNVRKLLGVQTASGMSGVSEIYTAVGYDAVAEVLRDGRRFPSSGYAQTMGIVMGRTILEMDEPEHGRYRSLIQQAFLRRSLERWEKELVRPVVHGLVDRLAARGEADLVRELTFPFPVAVIAGMIGIPEEDRSDFHRLAIELISIAFDPARGLRASQQLSALFARVLEERRRAPRDDLMSVLASAELDGTRLSDEEIFAFCKLLAPAGAETTYRSSSNLLCGLLGRPDQLEALRNDRSLLPQAIEEGLRWECPLTGIMRTAAEDTEVCGVPIPAGAIVHVNLGAANHDESRWERPEEFDLFRPYKQHIAFASGPHRCLGMHLATMETTVALEAVLDRLPGLRLDPRAEDVHVTGLIFRAPLALPVRFEAT